MAEITKEYCIQEMKRLAEVKGRPQLWEEFVAETNITTHYIQKLFLSFNNLMIQAGFEPRLTVRDTPLIPIDQMWQSYSEMLRTLKHPPSMAEWNFHNFQLGTTTFRAKFDCKFSEIPIRFKEFAKNKPEYSDVLIYLPSFDEEESLNMDKVQFEDYHLFIPPYVQSLEETENPNHFESQIGRVFQLLGFKTTVLGQGQGQNPDGIALRPKDNYALLYDAKSHQEGYSINASDQRAAEQYINDHRDSLEKNGMKTLFFIFVARSFTSECKKAAQDIREKTNVTTVLLTTSALLQLTAAHIQYPYDFDYSKLKTLFSKGGQIDANTIQPFLTEIQE